MKIYIDIGHGGTDPGAVNRNLIEHEMNMVTARACAERLQAHGHLVKVESGDLSISQSAKAANAFGADLLLSFHYNAGGGNRGEVIHSIRGGSERLAQAAAAGLKAAGQTSIRIYTKRNGEGTADYYGILRLSTMPAIIIEPCFIDNAADRTLADTPEKQKRIGCLIADAVAVEYGGGKKEESKVAAKDNVPSPWAKEAITWMVKNGVLAGDGNGDYKLHSNITKEACLVLIYAALKAAGVIR